MKKTILPYIVATLTLFSCGGQMKKSGMNDTIALQPAPAFSADTAFAYVEKQCTFGARVPGSTSHQACGDWIVEQFQHFGCTVEEQRKEVIGSDGKKMPCRNIIAHLACTFADAPTILFTAHWDSRAWADEDKDEAYHDTPVMAANDGASGIAVMLEMARVLQTTGRKCNIDFICFDTEDQGGREDSSTNSLPEDEIMGFWCLGSRFWAEQAFTSGYKARWAINLDMVGGRGSQFQQESISLHFAQGLVAHVWQIAEQLGYGIYFPKEESGSVTDDHLPINTIARIPAIDIIPHFSGSTSSFGPTWHTHNDTPEHIDPQVLKAVGQVMVQVAVNFQ